MSSYMKNDVTMMGKENSEYVETVKPTSTKGQKASRHCKKFWWAWLIAFGLLVMVVMLIIVYAILPSVAQKEINNTTLDLHSLTILSPAPSSFSLSINSTIHSSSGIAAHTTLDPMEVVFFLENHEPIQPFMSLPLDSIKGGGDIPIIKTNHSVEITKNKAFVEFANLLLGSETLRLAIRGRTKLWLGKLHTMVNYNEVLTIKGFNELKGMVIQKYDLLNGTQSDGANLYGKVLIPNPTVVQLQMGDVHIAFSLDGKPLGTGTIANLIMRPGNNSYDFRGSIEGTQLFRLADKFTEGLPVYLDVVGNGTQVDGKDIPWLSAPLERLAVKALVETQS